jgi:hypothetical protein
MALESLFRKHPSKNAGNKEKNSFYPLAFSGFIHTFALRF